MSALSQIMITKSKKHQITCGGICQNYRANMPPYNQSRYELGQKRCTKCGIFMVYDGRFCPCCGFRLRTHRRSSKAKRQARVIYN